MRETQFSEEPAERVCRGDVGPVSEETFLAVETLFSVRYNRSSLCLLSLPKLITEILEFYSFKN